MEEKINGAVMLIMVSVNNPVELIKSRIQTMNQLIFNGMIAKQYDGIIDCMKKTRSIEGVQAFWKGNSITLLRYYPNQLMNNKVKNIVQSLLPQSVISKIISGVCGGWVAAGVLYPFDTARIFISTSVSSQRESIKKLCAKIRTQGAKSLYKGYRSSLLAIALYRGSFFGCYDTLKTKRRQKIFKWFSAYSAGLMANIAVYPLETIRKNMILGKNNTNSFLTFKEIFKTDGVNGLYKGCSLITVQSVFAAATLIYFDSSHINKTC